MGGLARSSTIATRAVFLGCRLPSLSASSYRRQRVALVINVRSSVFAAMGAVSPSRGPPLPNRHAGPTRGPTECLPAENAGQGSASACARRAIAAPTFRVLGESQRQMTRDLARFGACNRATPHRERCGTANPRCPQSGGSRLVPPADQRGHAHRRLDNPLEAHLQALEAVTERELPECCARCYSRAGPWGSWSVGRARRASGGGGLPDPSRDRQQAGGRPRGVRGEASGKPRPLAVVVAPPRRPESEKRWWFILLVRALMLRGRCRRRST